MLKIGLYHKTMIKITYAKNISHNNEFLPLRIVIMHISHVIVVHQFSLSMLG